MLKPVWMLMISRQVATPHLMHQNSFEPSQVELLKH
jgi:hypothetical protein